MTAGTHQIDAAVIGGGVTGLASALALGQAGYSVALFEQHARPGMETSTHNSGVIHAGLYYPRGSLKATLCVEGAAQTVGIALDRAGWPEVVGPLAGDDTVFVATASPRDRVALPGAPRPS